MRSETLRVKAALESATQTLPRATYGQPQLSGASRRNQGPWFDEEEGQWKGCGFYFDGCSCSRCEESERRNRLNRKLCDALDLPDRYHSAKELEAQLHYVLNGLARWIERCGYLHDQQSEEGRQYTALCQALGVASGMRHSRHYWETMLDKFLRQIEGGR